MAEPNAAATADPIATPSTIEATTVPKTTNIVIGIRANTFARWPKQMPAIRIIMYVVIISNPLLDRSLPLRRLKSVKPVSIALRESERNLATLKYTIAHNGR
jgi:hypothetical protein